jgi:hypothetical protein
VLLVVKVLRHDFDINLCGGGGGLSGFLCYNLKGCISMRFLN